MNTGEMNISAELDETEKRALLGQAVKRMRDDLNDGNPLSQMKPRPGEKIQKFWCEGCEEWHTASVLGGSVGDRIFRSTHEQKTLC